MYGPTRACVHVYVYTQECTHIQCICITQPLWLGWVQHSFLPADKPQPSLPEMKKSSKISHQIRVSCFPHLFKSNKYTVLRFSRLVIFLSVVGEAWRPFMVRHLTDQPCVSGLSIKEVKHVHASTQPRKRMGHHGHTHVRLCERFTQVLRDECLR